MNNDIICISDLHLCDHGPRDNFNARGEDRFYRFLDYVEQQNCQLFILGDLFEWWQCNLSSTLIQYEKLIDRLNCVGPRGRGACWIAGNHDNSLTAFLDNHSAFSFGNIHLPFIRQAFTSSIGGKTVLFCHGHEGDPTCRDLNPGVGDITAIISGMLEDRNKGPNKDGSAIEDAFISILERALDTWRWLSKKYNRRKELINGIETYRCSKQAEVVIYGHTHEAGQIGTHHYNCGCWCRDMDTFVRVKNDGTASTFIWDGEKAVPYTKDLL